MRRLRRCTYSELAEAICCRCQFECGTRPHCAHCGALTVYTEGFELDHKVSLNDGSADIGHGGGAEAP